MPLARRSRSIFSRDVDAMLDSMLGDMNEMFSYEPFPSQRMSRPSYFLQASQAELNALVQSRPPNQEAAKNAFGITQDDKQLQIAVEVPGADASDVNLQLKDRLLTISGETKRENDGISVHSRFERSFALPQDVNADEISARLDDGVLTITAPKYAEAQDTVRKIPIAEEERKAESDEVTGAEDEVNASLRVDELQKSSVDESVIDLDDAKTE
ncbi:hypothetical protein ACHAXT_006141 [Thalassiosira profunda]